MLDPKTLFVVMIVTSLMLAASMAVAAGMKFRDGIAKWTGALVLQAVTYVFYLARGTWPDTLTILVPNGLFALCISLQAAAVLEFYGKKLSLLWHALPPLLIVGALAFLRNDLSARVIVTGTCFGSGLLISGLMLQRLDSSDEHPARFMVMGGFLVAAFAWFARVIAMIIDPIVVKDYFTPSYFYGALFLIGLAAIIITSVGFLLLHKERAEAAAKRLSVTDPLTGTFNRRTFLQLGAKEIARTRRSKGSLSLLMLDVDHFKKVNDQFGHQAGDEALKCVVDSLQVCLRREDLLVRYGGEEFCVLLPDVALDHATLLAERARAAVERSGFTFRGKTIPLTISVGVALLVRDSTEDIERLVSRADEALYSAKASGRNRVVTYPENSTIALLSRTHRRAPTGDATAE